MNFKDLLNPKSDTFKIAIAVVSILILIVVYRLIVKQVKYNKMNPRFFPSGKNAKKQEIIENDKLYKSENGLEYSMFTWLYVDNIVYKYGQWKHVLTKGNPGIMNMNQAPGIWIHPTHNIFLFRIRTTTGLDNIWVEDFPIRKWFSLALIVNNMHCDIYLNGKLTRTVGLKGSPKFNNGDLIVNSQGGFDGVMSSLACFSYALSPYDIIARHFGGPYGSSITENVVNFIIRRSSAIKKLVSIDDVKIDGNTINKLGGKYTANKRKTLKFYSKKWPAWVNKVGNNFEKYGVVMHYCLAGTNSISLADATQKYGNNGFIYAKFNEKQSKYLQKVKRCKDKPTYIIAGIKKNNSLNRDRTPESIKNKDTEASVNKQFGKWGWYRIE